MKKDLAIGYDSFSDLIGNRCYYVDKTPFLKTVLQDKSKVMLITRPRRFGKTLFMDTLKNFLQIDVNCPGEVTEQRELFEGLEILKDAEFCKTYMCQCPTIFLSLKSAEGPTFQRAYQAFARNLTQVATAFSFLENSPNLSHEDKEFFKLYKNLNYMRDLAHQDDVQSFLQRMIAFLSRHFGRQVVVLIDEYDVPLAKAAAGGYYDKMLPLIRGFLGEALKAAPQTGSEARPYLKKAILTGCLRVSKESIFTGLNNPAINTVWSEDLSLAEAIGFTPTDVSQMLEYYGLSSRSEDVKLWYDGYKLVGKDIYCPWDVINFADQALKSGKEQSFEPRNYWANTSSNEAIREFLGFLDKPDAEKMQTLVDGGSIDITVNDQLSYGDIKEHRSQDFWTLLLATGYLTLVNPSPKGASNTTYEVRIPNREILETFKTSVQAYFSEKTEPVSSLAQIVVKALSEGNSKEAMQKINSLLRRYISVRDTATKAPSENFYHGFLNGLFAASGSSVANYKSNTEAGFGYADIVFTTNQADETIGVVLEVKYTPKIETLRATALIACNQIAQKQYVEYFENFGCTHIYAYGVAFCSKTCFVSGDSQTVTAP